MNEEGALAAWYAYASSKKKRRQKIRELMMPDVLMFLKVEIVGGIIKGGKGHVAHAAATGRRQATK